MIGPADRPWVFAKSALCGLYAAFVARALGASPLLAVTVGVGASALALAPALVSRARNPDALRAAAAAITLILAALHTRALPSATPFHALHLGLAAAVASSSLVTLTLHRSSGRALATLAVCLPSALLVVLSDGAGLAPVSHVSIGLTAAIFAWLRPLGAVGSALRAAAVHQGPVDPGLFWDAVPALAHSDVPQEPKEVIRSCP